WRSALVLRSAAAAARGRYFSQFSRPLRIDTGRGVRRPIPRAQIYERRSRRQVRAEPPEEDFPAARQLSVARRPLAQEEWIVRSPSSPPKAKLEWNAGNQPAYVGAAIFARRAPHRVHRGGKRCAGWRCRHLARYGSSRERCWPSV